jgi:preprotein translocase subunit SecG
MQQLILILHVLIAIALVVLVLLQQGKGAQMGAAFGAGASQTLFGSQGSTSFLMKITGILAALFFMTSLVLGYLSSQQTRQDPLQSLTNAAHSLPATAAPVVPAAAPLAPAVPDAGVPIPVAGDTQPATK